MSSKVFVGNLPDEASSSSLRALFEEQVGAVRRAWLCRDPATGRPRGFGFVELEVAADAQRAVIEHELYLSGRRLAISHAASRPQKAAPDLAWLRAEPYFSCVPSAAVRSAALKIGI